MFPACSPECPCQVQLLLRMSASSITLTRLGSRSIAKLAASTSRITTGKCYCNCRSQKVFSHVQASDVAAIARKSLTVRVVGLGLCRPLCTPCFLMNHTPACSSKHVVALLAPGFQFWDGASAISLPFVRSEPETTGTHGQATDSPSRRTAPALTRA